MVGRLVEEHDVGITHEAAGQHDAALEPGRQLGKLRGRVELGARQDRIHEEAAAPGLVRVAGRGLVGRAFGQPGRNHVVHRSGRSFGHLLLQVGHPHAPLAHDDARFRRQLAHDQLQQRRLARAVAPKQAQPLPPLDLQVDVLQHRAPAESDAHIPHAH